MLVVEKVGQAADKQHAGHLADDHDAKATCLDCMRHILRCCCAVQFFYDLQVIIVWVLKSSKCKH